ncbi:MAG: hypothetical protein JSW62_04770 [Thermoplasmatales archaeon]|nr:MAG: hypothetical protein JSW62_04770 [Thermoplasmatales archaeon]
MLGLLGVFAASAGLKQGMGALTSGGYDIASALKYAVDSGAVEPIPGIAENTGTLSMGPQMLYGVGIPDKKIRPVSGGEKIKFVTIKEALSPKVYDFWTVNPEQVKADMNAKKIALGLKNQTKTADLTRLTDVNWAKETQPKEAKLGFFGNINLALALILAIMIVLWLM